MLIKTLKWKIETKATQTGEVNPRTTENDPEAGKRIEIISETINMARTMAEIIGTMGKAAIGKEETTEDNIIEVVNLTRIAEIIQGRGIVPKIKSKEVTTVTMNTENMGTIESTTIIIKSIMSTESTTKTEQTTESKDEMIGTKQIIVIIASELPITPTATRRTILIIDVFICRSRLFTCLIVSAWCVRPEM